MLFLTELTAAILFFAVACAVCIQIIARAHEYSQHSRNVSTAAAACSSVAELCQSADSLASIRSLFADAYDGSNVFFSEDSEELLTCCLYYDAEGTVTDQNSDTCETIQEIQISNKEDMIYCHQEVIEADDGSVVYDLDTVHHIQRRSET